MTKTHIKTEWQTLEDESLNEIFENIDLNCHNNPANAYFSAIVQQLISNRQPLKWALEIRNRILYRIKAFRWSRTILSIELKVSIKRLSHLQISPFLWAKCRHCFTCFATFLQQLQNSRDGFCLNRSWRPSANILFLVEPKTLSLFRHLKRNGYYNAKE